MSASWSRTVLKWFALCILISCSGVYAGASTDRLAQIRHRGVLTCGIWPHVRGFAVERDGTYSGFDVDICRAIAAGILGDAAKVAFVTVADLAQFRRHSQIDVVARRLTWTLQREAASGVSFGPIVFYDGQGFLVPKGGAVVDSAQLADHPICVLNKEHFPDALTEYLQDRGRDTAMVLVASDEEALDALRRDRCAAYSADLSWLAAARAGFIDGVSRYDILPNLISKEPLAPMVRAEDKQLLRVISWTLFALVEAEELGLDSHNVASSGLRSPGIRHFLAIHPGVDVAIEPGHWSGALIAAVGNYGEVFDRNLGRNSPINLDRGLNRLWVDGGLMYAPPLDR